MPFIFVFLFTMTSAWSFVLMKSPTHGQHVDISTRSLEFRWKRIRGIENYELSLYLRGPTKPTKTIRVKGNSYTVRFKKIPDRFYWKVAPEGKPSEGLFEIITFQRTPTIVRMSVSQTMSHVRLSSDEAGYTEDFSGPMIDASVEHFPRFLRNKWSLVMNTRFSDLSKGNNTLKEQKLGLEAGKVISSTAFSFHQLYIGYQIINQLKFDFSDGTNADYKVNFLTFRHLYSRHLTERWITEIQTSILFPFPYTFRPSLVLRPTIGYHLSNQWRIDGFIGLENFVSQPDDSGSDDEIDIYQRNFLAGIGFVFGFQ